MKYYNLYINTNVVFIFLTYSKHFVAKKMKNSPKHAKLSGNLNHMRVDTTPAPSTTQSSDPFVSHPFSIRTRRTLVSPTTTENRLFYPRFYTLYFLYNPLYTHE